MLSLKSQVKLTPEVLSTTTSVGKLRSRQPGDTTKRSITICEKYVFH